MTDLIGRRRETPEGAAEHGDGSRILVVEDDPQLREVVCLILKRAGWYVATEADGREALRRLESERFDLVVLDLMLPSLDGFEVCRRVRAMCHVPIVILTARTATSSLVAGLELGADDYLTKPFVPAELVARIRAVLRRVEPSPGAQPQAIGDLEIDLSARSVRKRGQPVHLSRTEFHLLGELIRHPGTVLSRQQLLQEVWHSDYLGSSRLIDMAIKRLRDKLEDDPANPRLIATVRGAGYRFDPSGMDT